MKLGKRYKISQMKGFHKFLWAYRVSEELWIWLLRMLKYRNTENAKTIDHLRANKSLLLSAILLMPISVFSIFGYFYKTYA